MPLGGASFFRTSDSSGDIFLGVLAAGRHHRCDDDDSLGPLRYGLVERLIKAGRAEFVEPHDHLTSRHLAELCCQFVLRGVEMVVLRGERPGAYFGVQLGVVAFEHRAYRAGGAFQPHMQTDQQSNLVFGKIIWRRAVHSENDDGFHSTTLID